MSAKEKSTARNSYPKDTLTRRVKQALKARREMHRDGDGWLVDTKTGELIGPDPAIERPLTKSQLESSVLQNGDQVVRRGRPPKLDRKQQITLRLDPHIVEHYRAKGPGWQTQLNADLRRLASSRNKRRQSPNMR
jgi:uncharacterized protein (DUF4415 family)